MIESEIAFNTSSSTPREASLYRNFQLELLGLQSGAGKTTPDSLSYLTVATPYGLQGVAGGGWHGLRFKLNLGTPGALASKINLNSTLLTAWSTRAAAGKARPAIRPPSASSCRAPARAAISSVCKVSSSSPLVWCSCSTTQGEVVSAAAERNCAQVPRTAESAAERRHRVLPFRQFGCGQLHRPWLVRNLQPGKGQGAPQGALDARCERRPAFRSTGSQPPHRPRRALRFVP